VAAIRQKSKFIQKNQSAPKIPTLSELQWQVILATAKQMAKEDKERHERTLFIVAALYFMYLRISELTESKRWSPQMRHFYQDCDGDWWFRTLGKGNKIRDIAVCDNMLEALKKWRKHLKLFPDLPTVNDTSPLVPKILGEGNITSTRVIRRIIQICFDRAIEILKKQRKLQEAGSLQNATVHWFRHTGISDDINKRHRPTIHVRDDAGHKFSSTTDRYNNVTLRERHASAKNK
jgi:integrase